MIKKIPAFFLGLGVIFFSGIVLGYLIYLSNAQRGLGVILFAVILFTEFYYFFEGYKHTALILVLIWVTAVIIGPGLYTNLPIALKPVHREVSINEIKDKTGIFYFTDAIVKKDMTGVMTENFDRHTYSQKKKTTIFSNSYKIAPLVDKNWSKEEEVTSWAVFFRLDKSPPPDIKYSVDWTYSDPYNAGVSCDPAPEYTEKLIKIAADKNGLTVSDKPVFFYMAENPCERSTIFTIIYSSIGTAVIIGWIFFCIINGDMIFPWKPNPENQKEEKPSPVKKFIYKYKKRKTKN